jgi:hypothetical protein
MMEVSLVKNFILFYQNFASYIKESKGLNRHCGILVFLLVLPFWDHCVSVHN